jgi:hypothetical protein
MENQVAGSSITLWQALSFYSPVITMVSILTFSVFSAALYKGLFYIFCAFVASVFRRLILIGAKSTKVGRNPVEICNTGFITSYTGWSYSTYILSFTLFYFITPMYILNKQNNVNVMNYAVIGFFVLYILYDFGIKMMCKCIVLDSAFGGDLVGGALVGGIFALILFQFDKISLMFINELNSNKEVCSVPSKQQFKCSVMRDGQIIGTSVSE